MLSHIVSDLHEVYVNEVIKPQIGANDSDKPKKESSATLKAGEGAEASAKRVRQATYDIRARAKKSGEDLETEYRKYIGSSAMQGDEKNQVKEKLGLTDTSGSSAGSVKEETNVKKFKVRVKDKDTGKTYVRNATRPKISELRANPNISSVEMTGYGKPSKGEAAKGSTTAKVKAGRGVDQDGDDDTDFADIMSARMQASGLPRNVANKKVADKPYNKKSGKSVGESFSNWREELIEVVDMVDSKTKKSKKEDSEKITGENVDNTSIIKLNPELKESVENLGGQLLDVIEAEEDIFEGVLDEIHDAEIFFINNSLIEEVVHEFITESIEDGYELDYIVESVEQSVDASLMILNEATVTHGHDTESDEKPDTRTERRSGVLNKIKRAVKKAAYGAGKAAGFAVRGAKKAAKLAKKGYDSSSGGSSSSGSSSGGGSADKKDGMMSRIGSSLKKGLRKAVVSGARSLSRGARNVARKMAEDLEMEGLDTWAPEKTHDTGDVDAKIKARKTTVKLKPKKPAATGTASYLPPASSLPPAKKIGEEKGLWDNIHAKRKRGERPAKPGEKGYPKTLNVEGTDLGEGLAQARKNVGASKCWPGKVAKGTKMKGGTEVPNCEEFELDIQEVITKKTPASGVISDFVHSNNPMFSGDTKKQRIKRALGAYYSKHPEKSDKKLKESKVVDLPGESDDSLRKTQEKTAKMQQDKNKKVISAQLKTVNAQKTQLGKGVPLSASYEMEGEIVDEAIKGLRPASERTKSAITPAQRRAQELARKRKQELSHKADLALAGMKKTAKPGAVTQSSSKPEAPEANRKLKTGKKVDTLAVKANKVIASSYEVDGDLVDEATAAAKRGLADTHRPRKAARASAASASLAAVAKGEKRKQKYAPGSTADTVEKTTHKKNFPGSRQAPTARGAKETPSQTQSRLATRHNERVAKHGFTKKEKGEDAARRPYDSARD